MINVEHGLNYRKLTEEEAQVAIDLYRRGVSLKQVMMHLRVPHYAIRQAFVERGIRTRTTSESRNLLLASQCDDVGYGFRAPKRRGPDVKERRQPRPRLSLRARLEASEANKERLKEALEAFMATYAVDENLCDQPHVRDCWKLARSALAPKPTA